MKRLLVTLAAALALVGCSKKEEVVLGTPEMCASVKETIRLIVQLERSGARSGAAVTNAVVDVRGLTALQFRKRLMEFPGREVHVWMPGEKDWLLVGHADTNGVSLAKAMEAFAADTNCTLSVAEVFASYAGTRQDVVPAFAGVLEGEVVPEWFVTREIPAIPWLDASEIDEDIAKPALADIRSMQVVRRLVLEGNMLAAKATDKKGEEKATDAWGRAFMRNPRDPMLLERLERLERNARGFLAVGKVLQAMKCYETMLLIRPKDAAAVNNFGQCLKKLGKLDMAEKVLKKARELEKRTDDL